MEQAKTQNEEHFNPYVKIEVLESERRLERQMFAMEKELRKDMFHYFLYTCGFISAIFIALTVYLEYKFK